MEEVFGNLLSALLKNGPGFVLAGVVLFIYFYERRTFLTTLKEERDRNEQLAKSVVSLSVDSIKADTEHTAAIQALTKVLDNIDRKVR